MKKQILELLVNEGKQSHASFAMTLPDGFLSELYDMKLNGEIVQKGDYYSIPTQEQIDLWVDFQNWLNQGSKYLTDDLRLDIIKSNFM